MPVASISYLTAALAFLVLAAVVLVYWRDRPGSIWIIAASLLSCLWALSLTLLSWQYADHIVVSPGALEVFRNAGWFAVLLSVLSHSGGSGYLHSRSLRIWIAVTVGFLIAVSIPVVFPEWAGEGRWRGTSILLMTIAGLILVEQAYRNTPPQRRSSVKLLGLGLGGMFAFDLFLFADLVLFEALETPTWQARGFVNALIVPLIAVAVQRRPTQSRAPTISRQLFFHTASLTGVGVYLLAVGGAGYYLRHAGGDLGALLQLTFLFGAVLLLALMLFSTNFRARLRVLLSKHFFKYRYDYREEWLRFTAQLSSQDATTPFNERALRAIAELADSPGGLLWVRGDDGNYMLQGNLNLGNPTPPPEPGTSPLVDFLVRSGWVIDIPEHQAQPQLYSGLQLPGWLLADPRHWAVIPLLGTDGLVGFVVLATPAVPHRIDWEERDLLKTAGRQLAVYVALVRTSEALAEARQLEAFHRLTAFLVHDLKNISAQLSLVSANAERHRDNPEFVADAFSTVANARDRLERTLAQLRTAQHRAKAPHQVFRLAEALRQVVAASHSGRPIPTLEVRGEADTTGDPEALKNVLLHLIRNAQEATPENGHVQLTLYTDDAWAVILVEDDGSGIEEDFLRRRLFRPFQTTKGNAGMGIGLYEARDQIRRMGGRIDVQSQTGEGTRFTIRLPLDRRRSATPQEPSTQVTNDV